MRNRTSNRQGKIFAEYISDKWLLCKIYKIILKFNNSKKKKVQLKVGMLPEQTPHQIGCRVSK